MWGGHGAQVIGASRLRRTVLDLRAGARRAVPARAGNLASVRLSQLQLFSRAASRSLTRGILSWRWLGGDRWGTRLSPQARCSFTRPQRHTVDIDRSAPSCVCGAVTENEVRDGAHAGPEGQKPSTCSANQ